jgi:GMP reductase
VCTTRKQTGVGYPQLSAVLECADSGENEGDEVAGKRWEWIKGEGK